MIKTDRTDSCSMFECFCEQFSSSQYAVSLVHFGCAANLRRFVRHRWTPTTGSRRRRYAMLSCRLVSVANGNRVGIAIIRVSE